MVPRHARKIGTKAYIKKLKKTLAPISIPGAKPMVMQAKIKGIRKLGLPGLGRSRLPGGHQSITQERGGFVSLG